MIINLLLSSLVSLVSAIFVFLPVVTIADIAYIGTDVSNYLTSAVYMWNGFIETFPYAGTGWNIFLSVIVPFEILLLIAKFFLGSRVPKHD